MRAEAPETDRPLVSVVIPTRDRSTLVPRAVHSALAQTLRGIEVIVVIDGADRATIDALRQIADPRLRLVPLEPPAGQADARNAGVAAARAPWIAFLDDDDLWAPAKLEQQLRTAIASSFARPIVACRLKARNGRSEFVWPRRLPRRDEAISEYLFCRSSLFSGEGVLPTSVIFTSRALVGEVPFRSGLRKHVDPDWLFRATARPGVGVEFVAEPDTLAVWHIEGERRRVSNSVGWEYSRAWIRDNRKLVTPRAYAGFLLTVVSADAARAGDWRAVPGLIAEAYRDGSPSLAELGVHLSNFFVPRDLRWRVAGLRGGR